MSAKIIILVRISTTRQEILTQKKELEELAIADGWKREDLIVIEGVGASAIKLNDIYLQEMEQLYRTIEDNDIAAVYAWEISRIGRNEEILMKFKNFLIERKIQLVIKNPSLRLLNNDGSVNNGIELAFSLFATMAKQEMEIKQARFKRARDKRKEEGKFSGGKIKLGYKLDKDKYFVVDDEKAQVVKDIYDWFVNDGLSLNKIYNRLCDMGIYHTNNPLTSCGKRVGYIIRDKSYKGVGIYPRIVNDNIWYKANEKLKGHQKPYETKNKYFCKGILRDKLTDTLFSAKVGRMLYVMRHKIHCINLNINALDYIALHSANVLLAHKANKDAQINKNDYKLKIDENENTITSKEKQIKDYQKATDRAIEMNIRLPEHFPTEKMETIIRQNDNAIQSLRTAISDLQAENTRMRNWLDGNQQFINTISSDLSDEKKSEMVQSVIEVIYVTKIGEHHYRIEVKNKVGFIDDTWYEYLSIGNKITISQHLPYGETMDMTQAMKNHRRFQRKP